MNELFRRLLNLPVQASSLAASIDTLHYVVIGTALLGLVVVIVAIGAFAALHREGGQEPHRGPPRLPGLVEAAAIAGLLTMFVAFWLVGERQYLALETPPERAMTVYVVAKQWMWSFVYPDGLETQRELTVPMGRPVKLVLTSRDVIHSFFVPAFRIKQDALPGTSTVAWFEAVAPGRHDILCAEFCGTSHSRMRGSVRVLRPEDYARWLEDRAAVPAEEPLASSEGDRSNLARHGERVASERGCLRCHTLDGTPHLGPSWAGLYGSLVPLANGATIRADDAYLTRSMMDPTADLRRDFPAIMPSYVGLLTPTDAASLLELMRSLAARRSDAGSLPLPVATPQLPELPVAQPSGAIATAPARGEAP
jgi:cytochrome c oxidase subunit 2